MTSLAIEQQALLDALFTRPLAAKSVQPVQLDDAIKIVAIHAYYTGAIGLKAYQNNGFSLAERTLMAHLGGGPTLEEAGSKLRAGAGECAVVWHLWLPAAVQSGLVLGARLIDLTPTDI